MSTKKRFYGWQLCIVLAIMYFCSSGSILYTAMIVNPIMLQDSSMALSGTLLSIGFTLFILMQGIPAPFVGQLVAKKGARFTMALGGAIMALGAFAMIFIVREVVTYIIAFGVFTSVGSVMAGQISVQSTVGQWFSARRGIAMTITMTLGGLASFATPLIVNAIVGASGGAWQSGWYLMAIYGIILIPIALIFVKNKPADIGQLPDGAESVAAFEKKQKENKVYKNTKVIEFKEAIRRPQFWLIALTGTGGFTAASLASSQGVIHFTTLGIDKGLIVGAVATMGIASVVGKILIGMITDRIEPIRLMSCCAILAALGIFLATMATDSFLVYVYYIFTGFGVGAITTTLPTSVANYFGPHAFSKNLGTTMLVTTIVSSTIPLISGRIFDITGFCIIAFYIASAVVLVCAICGFLVRIPKKKQGHIASEPKLQQMEGEA